QRGRIQRIEDQWSWRVDHLAGGFLGQQKVLQLLHVRLLKLIAPRLLPGTRQPPRQTTHVHWATGTGCSLSRTTRWRSSTNRPDNPLCRVLCRINTPSTHSATWFGVLLRSCPASSDPTVTRLNSATNKPFSSLTKFR